MKKREIILLYDGKCNVCNFAVQFTINRMHKNSQFYYASLQSNYGKEKVRKYGLNCFEDKKNPDIPTSSAVIVDNIAYNKFQGSINALQHMIFPYNMFGSILSVIPTFIGDSMYNNFAKFRFVLFGGTDKVQPIPKDKEHLFLDREEDIHLCSLPSK